MYEKTLNERLHACNCIIASKDETIASRDRTIATQKELVDILNGRLADKDKTIACLKYELEMQEKIISKLENRLLTRQGGDRNYLQLSSRSVRKIEN